MYSFSTVWCFQGVEKGCIGNKWFKVTQIQTEKSYYLITDNRKNQAKNIRNVLFDESMTALHI